MGRGFPCGVSHWSMLRGRDSEAISETTRRMAQGMWYCRQISRMAWDSISTASAREFLKAACFSLGVVRMVFDWRRLLGREWSWVRRESSSVAEEASWMRSP
jgi:hypothetical protein